MVPFQQETTFCGPACWVMTLMALSLFVPCLIENILQSKKGLIKMHVGTHNHFIQHQKRYSPEANPTHHTLCKRFQPRLRAMAEVQAKGWKELHVWRRLTDAHSRSKSHSLLFVGCWVIPRKVFSFPTLPEQRRIIFHVPYHCLLSVLQWYISRGPVSSWEYRRQRAEPCSPVV